MTKQEFDKIENGEIFAFGEIENSPNGIFMTRSGGMLKWAAVKGFGNDWCIYTDWSYNSFDRIKQNGQKVFDEYNIKKCVSCDDEVMKLYRY